MRARLQCTQFLCARACIKNRSGRKWQIRDSDHFLRKICGLWIWPSTIQNTCTQFLPQKFHPIHVWEQTVGDSVKWDPLYFRRFTLQDHMHDAPLSWFQFITECSEACGPDPSQWATINVNACTIYSPVPYQSIHEHVACNPHNSLQFDAVWNHNYKKYQHTDFRTETNKK